MKENLIAEFSQVSVMGGLKLSAAATQGACHNFTIEWISLILADNGDTSPTKAKGRMTQMAERSGAGNPVLQKIFGQLWSSEPSAYKLADRQMIALRGLEEAKLIIDYKAFEQEQLVQAVRNPQYSGFIYSFWFPGTVVGANGAHTIGFFRPLIGKRGKLIPTNQFVSAFDPNFGEYLIPELEFNYWFNKLKLAYGGSVTYHMLKCITPKFSQQNSSAFNQSAPTYFPWNSSGTATTLSNEPILLNGMKVIFDQSVGVYPVTLESKEESQRNAIPH